MPKILKITWEKYEKYQDIIEIDKIANACNQPILGSHRVGDKEKAVYQLRTSEISNDEQHIFLSYPANDSNKKMDKGTLCIVADKKIIDDESIKKIVFLTSSLIIPAKKFEIL